MATICYPGTQEILVQWAQPLVPGSKLDVARDQVAYLERNGRLIEQFTTGFHQIPQGADSCRLWFFSYADVGPIKLSHGTFRIKLQEPQRFFERALAVLGVNCTGPQACQHLKNWLEDHLTATASWSDKLSDDALPIIQHELESLWGLMLRSLEIFPAKLPTVMHNAPTGGCPRCEDPWNGADCASCGFVADKMAA